MSHWIYIYIYSPVTLNKTYIYIYIYHSKIPLILLKGDSNFTQCVSGGCKQNHNNHHTHLPGYCLKKPLALPKYCHMSDGSLSKLSTNTLFKASDQYTPLTIAESGYWGRKVETKISMEKDKKKSSVWVEKRITVLYSPGGWNKHSHQTAQPSYRIIHCANTDPYQGLFITQRYWEKVKQSRDGTEKNN